MSRRIREPQPTRLPVLLLGLVAAAAVACSDGGASDGPSGGPGRAAAPSPSIEQEVELGGLNLVDYCHFYGYDGNSGRSCYSRIPAPGEIGDKTAYCTRTLKTRDAHAERPDARTWVCERPIDLGQACDWQYGGHNLMARETTGGWVCVQ